MDWRQIEISGYAYYAERGYRILISLVRNDGYDFVAEKDGQFIRVNVKTAGLKSKKSSESWSISKASGSSLSKNPKKSKVDVYLVWMPKHECFLEMPGDFLDSGNSKSKLIPKTFTKMRA